MPETARPSKLRFAVMCRGTAWPAWQVRCIRELIALDAAELVLVIVEERADPAGWRASVMHRLRRRDLGWAVFDRWVAGRSKALRRVDARALLSRVPSIRCRTERRGRWSEHFSDADLELIRGHDLDFILRFAFRIIRGGILEAARYGVWSYHHDDEELYRGGPPCFWEIYQGDPVTGVTLQRLTERLDGGIVLHKGWFRTVAHSYVRNRDQAAFGAAGWPARICRDIANGTASYLEGPPSRSTARVYHNPTAGQMAIFMARQTRNFLAAQARGLGHADRWAVGVVDQPIHTFLRAGMTPPIRWIPEPSRERYLADPFPVPTRDGVAMLVEEYDYRRRRGVIKALRPSWEGPIDTGQAVLDHDGHASYPYVFEDGGDVYCVPETARSRRVDLYRSTGSVFGWQRERMLLDDVAALDPTIIRFRGLWWLFFADGDRDSNADLCVWFANDLGGPWEPHPRNPVKTDVRSSRPAGTPFVHRHALYRPAQDASLTYGGAVVINRLLKLTPFEFEEQAVAVVRPDPGGPYPAGLHTLAAAGNRTLVDGKRRQFIWDRSIQELGARTRKLVGTGVRA